MVTCVVCKIEHPTPTEMMANAAQKLTQHRFSWNVSLQLANPSTRLSNTVNNATIWNRVKFLYKDHSKLRPLSLLRPLDSVLKCDFQCKMCLINETCSLLRPFLTSTIGGLIIIQDFIVIKNSKMNNHTKISCIL